MHEVVPFNTRRVDGLDWVSYPILRFAEAPEGQHDDRPAQGISASTGAGEPPSVPVAAAIANAFFDATGVRITTAPMTPATVRATLAAAAVTGLETLGRCRRSRAQPGVRGTTAEYAPEEGAVGDLVGSPTIWFPTSRWAILDSNQGPPPYQSGALTN